MKKLIYTMTVSCLFFGLGSCDQEIDYPYEGKDRIYFDCFTFNSYTRIRTYTDSLTFSFGLIADSIRIDTARIVLHYSGNASEQERIYHVKVVQDSTTAEEGIHYQPIQKEQVFRPGRLTDTLKIVVLRDHMNSRFLDKERYRLELELEPSEDFDLGIRQGIRKTLWLNNYMSEPVWWEGNFHGRLGFFHPGIKNLPTRINVNMIRITGARITTTPCEVISITMPMPFMMKMGTESISIMLKYRKKNKIKIKK